MKRILGSISPIVRTFLALAFCLKALSGCDYPLDPEEVTPPVDKDGRTLIVYYSYTGHCEQIVASLTDRIPADVIRVQPADKTQKYEENDYAIGTAMITAIKENPSNKSSYPPIDPDSTVLENYDVILLVTPLWCSQMAAIMQSYLFENGERMAGKMIGLVVSSSSSGITLVEADAKRLVPDGKFYGESLWINNANQSKRLQLITNWLKKCGIKMK